MKTLTEFTADELRYLQLLSRSFPSVAAASTEIINLEAILNLPKGTEHFLADLHGEYEAFQHVLKNASGSVERKVNELFGSHMRESEKRELCSLIYYPREKLELVKSSERHLDEWYMITLIQLVRTCQVVSSKYTRSKVRKALPEEFSYIIQELMHESESDPNKQAYLDGILRTIISIKRADEFIVAMCQLIQRLVIDSLHIVGEIYDRGPGAHIIMDTLMHYHHVDIQWGNHDVLWMGAAAGNDCCIANVLRISLRYANLSTLEDGYGINLLPLATFAMEQYGDDPCEIFYPKLTFADEHYSEKNVRLIAQMHKAITMIQFKLEAQLIDKHPEYGLDNRKMLHLVDREKGVLGINGVEYPLLDTQFPTVDKSDPYRLTDEERELVGKLHHSFVKSERLERHIRFLLAKGAMYQVCNSNLMFHASIPMNSDGSFKEVKIDGVSYSGQGLMDRVDRMVRTACLKQEDAEENDYCEDYVWYLWCGPDAPPFDKSQMATFERYFTTDKGLQKEVQGHYYSVRNNPEVCEMILQAFGCEGHHRHIVNGHVPVKAKKGETPIRANGLLLVIDGGFSRAHQPETGIAGYTLVYNLQGLQLVQHEPFSSIQLAIDQGLDINSTYIVVEFAAQRMRVRETDIGKELQRQSDDLKLLLTAYRLGLIKEKRLKKHFD